MTRNTRLSARYWIWVKRMGKKKALVALGHTLLRIVYHVLDRKEPYKELGSDYLDRLRADSLARKRLTMIRQLELDGFVVTKQA